MKLSGKSILITGGTGSLGQALTKHILFHYPDIKRLIIYSRDEYKHYVMLQEYPADTFPQLKLVIGDIRDLLKLKRTMEGVDYVIHSAALKHICMAETNPMEFIKTNVLASENVINACLDLGVKKVTAVSTDKAVQPISTYGATKLLSDRLFLTANDEHGDRVKFSIIRLGNIMFSKGSVIPLFLKKRKEGVLPITEESMTRFNVLLKQGVDLVMHSLEHSWGGEIFIPKAPSYKITDLANAVSHECRKIITGMRRGEKLDEDLITNYEADYTYDAGDFYVVIPSVPHWNVNEYVKYFNALHVPENFTYNSSTNMNFLSEETLRLMIEEELLNV